MADSSGNLYGTTQNGGYYGYGTVFEILKGSGKITTLASFSYADGRNPAAGVTLDAAGNLFGTTMQGGGDGYESGTVFEIPKGTGRIQTLAYFRHEDFPSGSGPGEVALDQAGNVYGTTGEGGANDLGTVFRVSAGVQTIVSFDGANGEIPLAGVVFDSAGNMFGTTALGGPGDYGTVFEIANGTNTLQTIASFNGLNGGAPNALTLDASGNLFGSTSYGGTNGSGVVFEIVKGSGTVRTLASLDYNSSGANPVGHVALDAAGNMYGTTSSGGASGYGTVFKVAKGSATAQPIASFDMTKGFNPRGGVVLDSAGNLFGTTSDGGPLGGGVLFEIPKSTGVLQTVAAFQGDTGQNPIGVAMDASGNQYGTTNFGPNVNDGGTVFMIAKGSSQIQTLVSFDRMHDGSPLAGLTLDAAGNLYGTTQYGGTDRAGTIYKIAKGSHVIQTLASFPANGGMPTAGVTLDSAGNLFGTTTQGNVFELVKGTNTIKTLVSGVGAVGDVTLDSAGNLYGATSGGGAHGDGTIFKILKGTKTIQTLASFDGSNGAAPGGVALDSSGNLFGSASRGGAADVGTAFELVKGTSTIKTLASFTGANGAHPQTITLDAAGNLYGTTYDGGDWNLGTVFRIAKGTGTIETLLSFVFDNGANPNGAVRLDSAGNLYGTTSGGGLGNNGVAYELSPVTTVSTKVVVNSLQDVLFPDGSGTVSMRNAVAIANANSAPTTISFDPVVFAGTRTITLNGRDFELSNKSAAVTIVGPGASRLTINANDRSRIFRIDAGVTASISGFTLTNGNVYSIAMNNFDASGGGAIRNDGTLNLSNTFINANRGGQAGGGGLYNKGAANVINCTISNNHTDATRWGGGDGGGVEDDGPTLNLTNVTLAGNSVNNANYGGGINFGERGRIGDPNLTANLVNCTIVNNVASASYNGGGGVATPFFAPGTVTIANCIIANNSLFGNAQVPGVDVLLATSGSFALISKGHNLIGKADGSSGWTATDRTGSLANPLDPKLSALGNNGGSMPTIVPLAGSPAIDAGGNALIPAGVTTDQRGLPRISAAAVDIGATEVQSLTVVVTGFVLVNADTNKDIMPITEGMTLDLAALPRRLNIRAVASGNTNSVQVVFDRQSRLELQPSWSAFGDWNGDYIFGNIAAGSHTLTAQAFTGKAGAGTAGPITTLHFKVINKAPAPTSAVTAFVLFNTATGKDIRVLHNYDTLDLSLLPSMLGIRVQTSGTVGSVQYVVDGKMNAPAINALLVGQHHLTAIPYAGANATGTPGASLEIHLFVVRSVVAPGVQQPLASLLVS